jgi:hypothetical protein
MVPKLDPPPARRTESIGDPCRKSKVVEDSSAQPLIKAVESEPKVISTKVGYVSWRGAGYYRKTVVVFWERVDNLEATDSPRNVKFFTKPQ